LRYLLCELERVVGGKEVDSEVADFTIEHILPENPGDGWGAFGHEHRLRDVVRVGNLTPLEAGLNRAVGAAGFEEKRVAYAKSGYALTRGIAGIGVKLRSSVALVRLRLRESSGSGTAAPWTRKVGSRATGR
jgi:hypothetical protein